MSNRKNHLTLRLRELGGVIRAAGDIAKERKEKYVSAKSVYDSLILADTHINDCEDRTIDTTLSFSGYEYLPGDANMYNGIWPPEFIGSDVTYLVNHFRGYETNLPCYLDGFWCSADVNGDCNVIGSDITRMVSYFRGQIGIIYCPDYEPSWPTEDDLPPSAPSGWPNCETPAVVSDIQVLPTELKQELFVEIPY